MTDLKPGDTINHRYEVVRKLGAGAMGTVYLCEDIVENNIPVALKVLISENFDDQDAWAKGEYEALTRLRHPNLARVYNFGRIGETKDYFIASEFIKGIDLYSATEYVNYEELNDIIVQTCRALEYIHSRGYIHFDIKPDNVLVTRHKTFGMKEGSKILYTGGQSSARNRSVYSTPNVKLIDFGLAERITGSFSFAIKGTLNYLAPEIINGQKPDHRADLYSLGVTLYQITNRDLPHHFDDNEFQTVNFQAMKRSDLFEIHMKKVPEYLRMTILRLLEEDPAKRFQSAREVIQFISRHSGHQYAVETKETQKSYLHSTRMVGRKKEIHLLKNLAERIFSSKFCPTTEVPPEDPGEEGEGTADAEGQPQTASEEPAVPVVEDDTAFGLGPGRDPDFPAMVLVTGEMGIGKSRILEEFQHYLRLNDIQLYSGNCYEDTSNAYQPFVEILRQMVYGLGPNSEIYQRYERDLLKLLPEVQSKTGSPPTDMSSHPDKEKIVFIDRITQFFVDVAAEKPYACIVNNLHWADEVSLDLLEALVDRVRDWRRRVPVDLMILGSLRIDEQHSERLKELLTRKKDVGICQEIYLRRLKRSQLVELLLTMLGFTDVPALFLDRLEEKTGGNPLFIQETLKALQDEGVIKHTIDGWQIKTTGYNRVEIPHSLEELLLQRVRRLEPIKQEILEVMSVLNRPISPKVLQKFKRFSTIPILAHLRNLEESGLVTKVFEGGKLTFQIDQPKMREILYTSLKDNLRRRYHGEVGEFFAEAYRGHEQEILEDLAYHYQRSDLTEKALEMAVRAGDRLKAIYASERALDFYLYIVEKTETNPGKTQLWVETQEKIGDLCTIMGRYDVAENSFDSLLNLETNEPLSPLDVSRYYRKKGKIFEIQGDYDTALRCYKDARGCVSDLDGPEYLDERIRVFNCIGWVYVCMGKYEKAMAISVEGLRVIEAAKEKAVHAMIYSTIGSANFYKGNYRQAVEFHSRSLKIQENLENIPEITVCLNNLGKSYMASADYAEALEQFQRALENSEEIGDPYGRGTSLHNLGVLYFDLGKLEQAASYVAESLKLSRSYNMRFLNIENYILYGKIKREQRDYSRAESHLFRALTAYSKQGNRWGLCTVLLDIISIHRLRGSYVEAASMVEEAFRYAADMDIELLKCRCLLEKARVLRDSGDNDSRRLLEFFEEALAMAGKLEAPELRAEIHREYGDLLVKDRRLEKAKTMYRSAEDLLREVLERLPVELQQHYRAKHRKYFHLEDSVVKVAGEGGEGDRALGGAAAPSKEAGARGRVPGAAAGERSAAGDRLTETHAMDCMNELMQALKHASSLEEFLELMLRRFLDLSRARMAFVLARQEDRLHIRHASGAGSRAPLEDAKHLLVMRLIQKVLQSGKALAISDLVRDPHLADLGSLIKKGFRSLLILPYQSPLENGVIYLVDPVPREARLADDLVFYNFFSNLLPLALMQLAHAGQVAVVEVEEETV